MTEHRQMTARRAGWGSISVAGATADAAAGAGGARDVGGRGSAEGAAHDNRTRSGERREHGGPGRLVGRVCRRGEGVGGSGRGG